MSQVTTVRVRVLAAAVLLFGAAGYGVATGTAARSGESVTSVARLGRVAPELPVRLEDGTQAKLSTLLKGRRTVVVFHSPACGVCAITLPSLQPFPPSLQLFMVDVSGNAQEAMRSPPESPRHFTADKRFVQRLFPFSGLPTIILLDEAGVIRAGLAGSQPAGRIQEALLAFAGGKP
jgi:hypothetical protein